MYLIEILHQTTTEQAASLASVRLYLIEILHQTTTYQLYGMTPSLLYLIEILHQTTTLRMASSPRFLLYLIEILHQTTTSFRARTLLLCCILSKFYIKPQRSRRLRRCWWVVSYRNSTSNHNGRQW